MKLLPESASELAVLVRDNSGRHSMEAENIVKKNAGDIGGSVCGPVSGKVDLLGEFVNKHNDSVMPSWCLWQLGDKVHGNGLPSLSRNRQRLEEASWPLDTVFVALAVFARCNIQLRVTSDPGPVNRAAESIVSLVKAQMSSYGRVMSIMEQGEANVRLLWNAHKSDAFAGDAEQFVNK